MVLIGSPPAVWSSRTPIQRWRKPSMTPSANLHCRSRTAGSGVNGAGCEVPFPWQ